MKNILILTDFSTNSWNSIIYTLQLFKDKTIHFFILKAQNDIRQDFIVKNSENDTNDFQDLFSKINASVINKKHTFEAVNDNKDIITATKDQLKEKSIDLIIIGASVLSSKNNKKISPICEELITKVPCDILVVPNKAKFSDYNQVVFPTEFTNFLEAKLLHNLLQYSPFEKVDFKFLYLSKNSKSLNKDQQWNKEALHDYFKDIPHSFHEELNHELAISLDDFVIKTKSELIITAAKNLNLIEQLLFRPVGDSLNYINSIPFLVLTQNIF